MRSVGRRRRRWNTLLVAAAAGPILLLGGCVDPAAGNHRFGDMATWLESRLAPAPAEVAADGRGRIESRSVDLPSPEPAGSAAARQVLQTSADVAPLSPAPSGAGSTLVAHAVVDHVVAHAGPASSQVVASFENPNRHGGPLVFQSLTPPDSALIRSGWIPVLLPIRPNGTVGWIRTSSVELTSNPFRIEVDVDDFTLTVFRGEDEHYSTMVGIGDGATPTPRGSFYLTDLLKPSNPAGIYGPYAYGLSGFSETLDSFNGGPGVIGIHGTNQPEAIGTRVSHGCIRVANDAIEELASFLPLGTPVVIDEEPSEVDAR
jgi:lipoprotein-anchoring transpeptidase ErfK/SrfK